jgi:predicted acylesterase/phospholipase RssA
MSDPQKAEFIIECTPIGTSLRVTAVDVATGTEVHFQAPANAGKAELHRIAANKLQYVLRKQKDKG